jgi:hypothetical protein
VGLTVPTNRKFTDEEVVMLRKWYALYNSVPNPSEMARRNGISRQGLMQICKGHSYKEPKKDSLRFATFPVEHSEQSSNQNGPFGS